MMRVQKLLASAGYGSRREIERWISEGRIKVDGRVVTLGESASLEDAIVLDDRPIEIRHVNKASRRVILYSKPEGEICTRHDPEGRPTVFDHLPKLNTGRWIIVGRLDINSRGLLLFTNDGELAAKLMHPSNEFEREYLARVHGCVTENVLRQLQVGVQLDDGFAHFKSIQLIRTTGKNSWCSVVLTEGRNREVRRLFESQDLTVNRLIRTRFAHIKLPRTLAEGEWMELPPAKVSELDQ